MLVVNVGDLNAAFKRATRSRPNRSPQANLVKGRFDELKILGDGEVTKKLKISAHRFSKSATEKITSAGGEAIVLPGPAPVVKNKKQARPRRSNRSGLSASSVNDVTVE